MCNKKKAKEKNELQNERVEKMMSKKNVMLLSTEAAEKRTNQTRNNSCFWTVVGGLPLLPFLPLVSCGRQLYSKRLVTQNASLPVEGVRGPTNGVMVEMRDPKEEEKTTPRAEGRERYMIGYCLPFSPGLVLSLGW